MERPEPRVRLCQIERGGGKLVAEGDVRAVAPLMKVLDWLGDCMVADAVLATTCAGSSRTRGWQVHGEGRLAALHPV